MFKVMEEGVTSAMFKVMSISNTMVMVMGGEYGCQPCSR